MSGKWIVVVMAVVLAFGTAAYAAQTADVTLTVTIRSLGVSVTPASYDFGFMNTSETKVSTALAVKNEGNVAEDFGLRVKTVDDKGWSLAAAPAENTYTLSSRFGVNAGTFGASDILTASAQMCDGTKFGTGGFNTASLASENMWLQMQTPTSVTGVNATAQHTITLEVSCQAH